MFRPEHGRNSQGRKHVGRHSQTIQCFRWCRAVASKVGERITENSHGLQRVRPFADLLRVIPKGEVRMHLRGIRIDEFRPDLY